MWFCGPHISSHEWDGDLRCIILWPVVDFSSESSISIWNSYGHSFTGNHGVLTSIPREVLTLGVCESVKSGSKIAKSSIGSATAFGSAFHYFIEYVTLFLLRCYDRSYSCRFHEIFVLNSSACRFGLRTINQFRKGKCV